MAAFVDCAKYNKDKDAQHKALENLAKKDKELERDIESIDKRKIIHDSTLDGGGIDPSDPLTVVVSGKDGNAVKTGDGAGEKGLYVKDLEPDVENLKKAVDDTNNRLAGDLSGRIRELNDKLNSLKALEVALAQAKADGNYQKIKDLEAKLAAAKQAEDLANSNLADAIDELRRQGLSDDKISQIIADSIAKAGGSGRYITGITVDQATGNVTYTYSDGTKITGKLNDFKGVVVDNITIGGNGTSEALHIKLSRAPGNSLQVIDGGLYSGEDRQISLFVDSVNGDDSNVGTRSKPLRTFNKALARSTEATGGKATIYLHEEQTHQYQYAGKFAINNNLGVKTYGPKYDAIYAEYYKNTATQGGWWPEFTDEHKAIMPKLVFIPNKTFEFRQKVGDYTTAFEVRNKIVTLTGISISYQKVIGDVPNTQWRSLFYGHGRLQVHACRIDNSNAGLTWALASDHDGSLSVDSLANVIAKTPSGIDGTIFYISLRMEITFKAENSTYTSNNTHTSPSTSVEDMLKTVYGAGEKSAYIGNFVTNVKL